MGPALVLATWFAWVAVLATAGWAVTHRWRLVGPDRLRASLWAGLLMLLVVVLAASMFVPLGSTQAARAVGAALLVAAIAGAVSLRRTGWAAISQGWRRPSWAGWAFAGALLAAVVVLAIAVLGQVTHYDTGLYHWGAIRYAYDYPVITGMANLFIPFGYSNSLFSWAAFLGNGPWDGEGFRLVNGLSFTLLVVDVVLRLLSRRSTVGLPISMVGVVVAALPFVGISSFWTASPSPDPTVMVLTFACLAALADEVAAGSGAATALATAAVAASMRPLMIVFLLVVLVALAVISARRRTWPVGVAWVAIWSVLMAMVQTARDYRLSGWAQYPLGFIGFDVPWRAIDPSLTQGATLGNARDPSGLTDPLNGWSWIGPWLGRLPYQWESLATGGLLLAGLAVVLLVPAARTRGSLRGLALVLAPAVATDLVWFVATPPSFRFAWGPIFGLGVVLLGWGLAAWNETPFRGGHGVLHTWVPASAASVLAILVLVTAAMRLQLTGPHENRQWVLGGISVPYSVVALPLPPVREVHLAGGLTILEPTQSDQCWARYPLCTYGTWRTVTQRGGSWTDGFLPGAVG